MLTSSVPALSFATRFPHVLRDKVTPHPYAGQETGYKGKARGGDVLDVRTAQERDQDTGEPAFWPLKRGETVPRPKMAIVVTVQSDERHPWIPNDDGVRAMWITESSELYKALKLELTTKQAKLRPGGRLLAAWVSERPSKKPGAQDAKVYVANYTPGVAPGVDEMFAAPAAAQQPAPPQTPPADPWANQAAAAPLGGTPVPQTGTYTPPAQTQQPQYAAAASTAAPNPFGQQPAPQQAAAAPSAAGPVTGAAPQSNAAPNPFG